MVLCWDLPPSHLNRESRHKRTYGLPEEENKSFRGSDTTKRFSQNQRSLLQCDCSIAALDAMTSRCTRLCMTWLWLWKTKRYRTPIVRHNQFILITPGIAKHVSNVLPLNTSSVWSHRKRIGCEDEVKGQSVSQVFARTLKR